MSKPSASPPSAQDSSDGSLPGLEFVAVERLQKLEQYRISREGHLCRRVQAEGVLANPLIASPSGKSSLRLLLDGHHRLESLDRLGCQHALIQRVALENSRQVRFEAWMHLACVETPEEILAEMQALGLNLQLATHGEAEVLVSRGQAVCWMSFYEALETAIVVQRGTLTQAGAFRLVDNLYQPRRITAGDLPPGWQRQPARVFTAHGKSNLLVRFATLGPAQLKALVESDERIPSGVMRTLLPAGRVVGVNVPLELLRAGASDRDRQDWLKNLQNQHPRYISGPTVIDEEPHPRRYEDPLIVYDANLRPRRAS